MLEASRPTTRRTTSKLENSISRHPGIEMLQSGLSSRPPGTRSGCLGGQPMNGRGQKGRIWPAGKTPPHSGISTTPRSVAGARGTSHPQQSRPGAGGHGIPDPRTLYPGWSKSFKVSKTLRGIGALGLTAPAPPRKPQPPGLQEKGGSPRREPLLQLCPMTALVYRTFSSDNTPI